MSTYVIPANTRSDPIPAGANSIVQVTGTYSALDYTQNSIADIANGQATWTTLSLTSGSAIANEKILVRVITGATSVTINTISAPTQDDKDAFVTPVGASTGGGSSTTDVQTFTASGTWNKPAGAKYVIGLVIGGGGGSGGGARVASGAASGGGGGAGAFAKFFAVLPTALSATEAVTIGAGGTAGAGATVDGTAGTAGSFGGNSSFNVVTSFGSGGGAGGQVAATSGGGGSAGTFARGGDAVTTTAGGAGNQLGNAGGNTGGGGLTGVYHGQPGSGGSGSITGTSGAGGYTVEAPCGGSAGGGITAGGASIAPGAAAQVGNVATNFTQFGFGPAGGASNIAGAGAAGTAGTNGAGASGGGAAIGGNGGAGAVGGGGLVQIITFL